MASVLLSFKPAFDSPGSAIRRQLRFGKDRLQFWQSIFEEGGNFRVNRPRGRTLVLDRFARQEMTPRPFGIVL